MSKIQKEEIAMLYNVRKTVLEMLKDRGYLVSDLEINMSKHDFVNTFGGEEMKRENLEILKVKENNSADQIYVFFPEEAKFGVHIMKKYADRLHKSNIFKAILVVQERPTSFAKTCIEEILSPRFHIEVFMEPELSFNITKHVLVPEHRVLTDTEKKTLLERHTVKETQLPRIQVNDPVSRYYGLERGQVVKIIRSSETAGKYITYRIVV